MGLFGEDELPITCEEYQYKRIIKEECPNCGHQNRIRRKNQNRHHSETDVEFTCSNCGTKYGRKYVTFLPYQAVVRYSARTECPDCGNELGSEEPVETRLDFDETGDLEERLEEIDGEFEEVPPFGEAFKFWCRDCKLEFKRRYYSSTFKDALNEYKFGED